MSLSSRPADLTAAGIATAGPIPITPGSTPTAAKLLLSKRHGVFRKEAKSSQTWFLSQKNSYILFLIKSTWYRDFSSMKVANNH